MKTKKKHLTTHTPKTHKSLKRGNKEDDELTKQKQTLQMCKIKQAKDNNTKIHSFLFVLQHGRKKRERERVEIGEPPNSLCVKWESAKSGKEKA